MVAKVITYAAATSVKSFCATDDPVYPTVLKWVATFATDECISSVDASVIHAAATALANAKTITEGACSYTNPMSRDLAGQLLDNLGKPLKLAKERSPTCDKLTPMLRCDIVKDFFGAMYMPMCIDAFASFGLVSASSGFGGVVMLFMMPLLVLVTKRLNKKKRKEFIETHPDTEDEKKAPKAASEPAPIVYEP